MSSFAAVVPAAGRSSRFGSQKLVATVGGEVLLARTLASVLSAGVSRVAVVLAPDHTLGRLACLDDPRVVLVTNPDPSPGMFSSIREGLAQVDGALIAVLPADMPFVQSDTIAQLLDEAKTRNRVVVPSFQGRRGHPIVIPAAYRLALVAAPPDLTLKSALIEAAGQPPDEIEVRDPGVLRDVDVPSDLH